MEDSLVSLVVVGPAERGQVRGNLTVDCEQCGVFWGNEKLVQVPTVAIACADPGNRAVRTVED